MNVNIGKLTKKVLTKKEISRDEAVRIFGEEKVQKAEQEVRNYELEYIQGYTDGYNTGYANGVEHKEAENDATQTIEERIDESETPKKHR